MSALDELIDALRTESNFRAGERCRSAEAIAFGDLKVLLGAAAEALDQLSGKPSGISYVNVPTNEDEGAAMALIAINWLKENAPHRLSGALQQPDR